MKSAILPLLLLTACLADPEKGDEEAPPSADGKDDSFWRPTEHGPIGIDQPQVGELSAWAGYHAWTFELTGPARVEVATGPEAGRDYERDTVIYLYRQRQDGSWGGYLARNDDAGDSLWSAVERDVSAGLYRVIVKGYRRSVRGTFELNVGCTGAGCAPPARDCVFGDTYYELAEQPGLEILSPTKVTAATTWLTEQDRQRIVVAVQQSSHTDVTTAEEAFERVDGGEINVTRILEAAARRSFIAVEYGAGDNSYGAIFDEGVTLLASIHDGDLLDCATPAEVCLLPESYRALLDDPTFDATATRTVTSAAALSPAEADQVLDALRRVYGDAVTSLAQGLTLADDDRVNLTALTHADTATEITAIEFGAGDTSVGRLYFSATVAPAGSINDGSLDTCRFFAPH